MIDALIFVALQVNTPKDEIRINNRQGGNFFYEILQKMHHARHTSRHYL